MISSNHARSSFEAEFVLSTKFHLNSIGHIWRILWLRIPRNSQVCVKIILAVAMHGQPKNTANIVNIYQIAGN